MNGLTIDNRILHYRVDGPDDGIPLVFSNSLGTDFRIWEPMLAHLPEGYRILRYDTAGHGLSDLAGTRRIEDHAADVLALMDHVGMPRATVIGLSVGGLIAQGLYSIAPERMAGVIFCDTAHKIGNDDIWNPRIEAIEKGGMAAVAEPTMERWFTASFRENGADYRLWRAMLLHTPAKGYCDLGRAIRDADFTDGCAALTIPALCLCGEDDGATPPALVQDFAARLPNARYVELADCAHIPCVEQPERLAAEITAFVAAL